MLVKPELGGTMGWWIGTTELCAETRCHQNVCVHVSGVQLEEARAVRCDADQMQMKELMAIKGYKFVTKGSVYKGLLLTPPFFEGY